MSLEEPPSFQVARTVAGGSRRREEEKKEEEQSPARAVRGSSSRHLCCHPDTNALIGADIDTTKSELAIS